MKFIGQSEVVSFIDRHPKHVQMLCAWTTEMKHRNWTDPQALSSAFCGADVTEPPRVIFRLGSEAVRIETLIDFRSSVVVLTSIEEIEGLDIARSSKFGNA